VEAPAIRTVALDTALPELEAYDLVCVTSPVGASQLWSRLRAAGLDARALAGRRVAAIGPGTARALEEHGIVPDVVPARAVAEGLVEALTAEEISRALVLRAREGRDVLPDALRARGASVDVLALYETLPEPLDDETAVAAREADYLTFTSASTVRFFVAAAGEDALRGPRVASIGPATSEALREHGVSPDLEADPHTPDGLVDALVADAERLP
jgi:uroporphyrinogen III methyltransferase/synthase